MPSPKFRELHDEDVNSLEELSAKVFHEVHPKEYFVWKFIDNPAGRGSNMVAEVSGNIVGHGSLIPTPLRIGNEVVLGGQGVDSMIHPDHQGLFVPLFEACMELAASKGIEVAYGCPNQNSFPALVHMLNWDHTGEIPQWLRILNPNANWLASLSLPKKLASWGMHLLPLGNRNPPGCTVRVERPSDQELLSLDDLTSSKLPARTCRIGRSPEWFKWRFDAASQHQYQWFSAYRDGELKAWAVFGLNDSGEQPMIDMSGIDPAALEASVSAATRRAKELGLATLVSVTNDDAAIQTLKSCGYLRRKSMPLTVRSLTTRILNANIHSHSSWRLTSQDLDGF